MLRFEHDVSGVIKTPIPVQKVYGAKTARRQPVTGASLPFTIGGVLAVL
jgi:hypothetical protein